MRQYHNDQLNPDEAKARDKKMVITGTKPSHKMTVKALAHWHNITDINKILAPPIER